MRSTKCVRGCSESSVSHKNGKSWRARSTYFGNSFLSIHSFQFVHVIHSVQFIRFNSWISIPSFQVLYFNSFFQFLIFLHFNSFMSIHVFQFLHFNLFMSIHSFQFVHVNSFRSIHSCQFIHANSLMSILHFKAFISIDSCQIIRFMHFISFRLTSFQLTMNSFKPCLFFRNFRRVPGTGNTYVKSSKGGCKWWPYLPATVFLFSRFFFGRRGRRERQRWSRRWARWGKVTVVGEMSGNIMTNVWRFSGFLSHGGTTKWIIYNGNSY